MDFPEGIQLELYSEGQLLHTLLEYGTGDPGLFVGVLSSQPFDAAVIRPPGFSQAYAFDDLHFGVPGPCTAAVLGAGALCCTRRRRRCCQQTNRSKDRV